ncbi:aldo/keto reductase [Candidatus Aerophobetes bacterium]|nr:aldo/keto reductase [Candidatus Aerophobetes bacterium]
MEFKNLTPDVKIAVLGLGTWSMGGGIRSRNTAYDKENIRAIKTAIELGMTHIDTAEMYGGGHAEELVGEAIKSFDREKLFITTKVLPENLRYNDVISAAQRSLQALKTDYIDLYLVHIPNPAIPIEQTMQAFDFLKEKGLIRFIGVSNFTVVQLKEAQMCTRNKIVANQIEYSLLVRNEGNEYINNMESEVIPYCQENDTMVVAYRPLARGRLSKPGIKVLDELARKYGKTQAQIAINWLISKDKIITIPKTSNLEHLQEDIGALGWQLEPEDMHKLDKETG